MSVIVAIALFVATASAALATQRPGLARSLERVRIARGELRGGVRDRIGASLVFRLWRPIDDETLRLAGLPRVTAADVGLAKICAAAAGAVVGLIAGIPPAFLGLVAFAGFVAPSEWVRRRASVRQEARRESLLPFVERAIALSSAGMTFEQLIAQLAVAESPLAPILREVRARAELGVPVLDALSEAADRERLADLRDLARDLARSRRGGRPLHPILAERRDSLRLARRAARLEAASRVDGALSLVLVLAYLPALLVLVVIPLFLGLLRSLGT